MPSRPGEPADAGPGARAGGTPVLRGDDRVLTGAAAGLAARLGIEPTVVRAVLVVLTLAGGVGALAYVLLWVASAEPGDGHEPPTGGRASPQQLGAVAAVTVGALLLLRAAGLWLGDGVVWPVAAAAAGSTLVWLRGDAATAWIPGSLRPPGLPAGAGISPVRLVGGVLLVAVGMASFLAANDALPALRDLMLAGGVTVAGLALLLGPWLAGLVQELTRERRERIRSEERSAMAAHLHDSVLQTLALIQRSDDPRRMASLARRQERELRSWLYGPAESPPALSLAAAVAEVADGVETDHGVVVNEVVVGDAAPAGPVRALLGAVREGLVNAAKHAGVGTVSVYVEVEADRVVAYVRDRGAGFDPDAVPPDRQGLRTSVVGRLERVGGGARVRSAPGEGTELTLTVPTGAPSDAAASAPTAGRTP